VNDVYAADPSHVREAVAALSKAWEAVRTKGIPPQIEAQMRVDIEALSSEDVQSAALRVAQNELDLRLLYESVIDVDLARLKLWTRQLAIDVAAEASALVLADVAALERVWERTRHGVDPAAAVDAALHDLRKAADVEDLAAVERAAAALNTAVSALHTR
jgi:hypothetical protein